MSEENEEYEDLNEEIDLEEANMVQLIGAMMSFEPGFEGEEKLREIMVMMGQAYLQAPEVDAIDPESDTETEIKRKVMARTAHLTLDVDEFMPIVQGFVNLIYSCDYLSGILEDVCTDLLNITPVKLAELVKTSQEQGIPLETLYESYKTTSTETAENIGEGLLRLGLNKGFNKPN